MGHLETLLAKLLNEQNAKKAELDQLLHFDFMGITPDQQMVMQQYEYMKKLAARIIEIEAAIDQWVNYTPLPILLIEGYKESVNN